MLDAGGEGAVAGGRSLAVGAAFVIRPAAGQHEQGRENGEAAARHEGSWSVDVSGSPSAAAASRGTSSFSSVGMLSTDGNEVAS